MFDMLEFLGGLFWGFVGLFRRAATPQAKRLQKVGIASLAAWVCSWGATLLVAEEWRFTLFLMGVAFMAIFVFCGYLRLEETGKGKKRQGEEV
jgi:hypothetical protein